MTSAKEMAEQLTEILCTRVENISSLVDTVISNEQAMQAGIYLESAIIKAQAGRNPHFCDSGIETLKMIYNDLRGRFPELEKSLGPKYELRR